jgi:hypothetical protein
MRTKILVLAMLMLISAGCKLFRGPDRTGEFRLSSEGTLGELTYYWIGYSYEDSEYYRYPFEKDPLPDLINLGYRSIGGAGQSTKPGFNTPGKTNGFAKVGEFETMLEARSFYDAYREAGSDLQFVIDSDTVELFQVWVQKTSLGNFAKLLVKDIQNFEGEGNSIYNEVVCDYTYQPNGSREFPK